MWPSYAFLLATREECYRLPSFCLVSAVWETLYVGPSSLMRSFWRRGSGGDGASPGLTSRLLTFVFRSQNRLKLQLVMYSSVLGTNGRDVLVPALRASLRKASTVTNALAVSRVSVVLRLVASLALLHQGQLGANEKASSQYVISLEWPRGRPGLKRHQYKC